MKRFLGMFFMLSLLACSRTEEPRVVAEKFLEAMQRRDFREAASYGTTETVKLLNLYEKITSMNGEVPGETHGRITIVSEDIKGKTATVYFREEGNDAEQRITLKKVKEDGQGEWKVALKKDEIDFGGDSQNLQLP